MSTKLRHYVIQVRVNSLWQTIALSQYSALSPREALGKHINAVTPESPIRVCESTHGTELIPLVQLTIEHLVQEQPVARLAAVLQKPDVDDIPF